MSVAHSDGLVMTPHTAVGKFCTENGSASDDVKTRGCLSELLSNVIFIASVGHACTNFPQKNIGAYAPALMAGPLVKGPADPSLTADDMKTGLAYMKMLPAGAEVFKTSSFGGLLGSVHYNKLGDYRQTGDGALDAKFAVPLQKFKSAIAKIKTEIDKRNAPGGKGRRSSFIKYETLLPDKVPQSIYI